MDEQLKKNVTASSIWIRLIFMILYAFVLQVAMAVLWVIVCVQFLFSLITGQPNEKLAGFADSFSQFIYQCVQFETFGTEEKPFPFSDFPEPKLSPVDDLEAKPETKPEATPEEKPEIEDGKA